MCKPHKFPPPLPRTFPPPCLQGGGWINMCFYLNSSQARGKQTVCFGAGRKPPLRAPRPRPTLSPPGGLFRASIALALSRQCAGPQPTQTCLPGSHAVTAVATGPPPGALPNHPGILELLTSRWAKGFGPNSPHPGQQRRAWNHLPPLRTKAALPHRSLHAQCPVQDS